MDAAGDPTQLHQVLLNLCVNARDAMPDGGQITITAENIVIDEAYAALNIDAQERPLCDDRRRGHGHRHAEQTIIDQIFDPFFTTKEIGKGTGLGLATSLAIVTGHKGFMRVYSEPGAGTRFQLYLPAQTTPATAVGAPVRSSSAGQRRDGAGGGRRGGDPADRKRTLEAFGYRVLLASDGAEAVALYAQHQAEIAVVLTDMMMPVMDGAATIRNWCG